MADWVWTEGGGTTLTEEPRLRTARFGDGYEQSAPDGLNNLAQVWDYAADDVDDAVADDMVAFLRTQNGAAFNYVPLRATTALRFKCKSWSRSFSATPGFSSLRAKFEQAFEP